MRSVLLPFCAILLVSGMFVGPASAQGELEVPIVIAPSTINIDLKGVWVTVHAEIPYSEVVGAKVTLEGVAVKVTFADNRGDLVAKFIVGDVIDILVSVGENGVVTIKNPNPTLTLCGETKLGVSFWGQDKIRVISNKK